MHDERTYIKLQVMNVTVKTTSGSLTVKRTISIKCESRRAKSLYRNFGVWVPFLECFEFYKVKDKYQQRDQRNSTHA
jgi:hypothetical protein